MVWHIPTILVGEFHGIHGAHMWLVSQFYTFQRHQCHSAAAQRSQLGAFSLMDASGDTGVLVGRVASSGVVNEAVQATLHSIAARALATDDEKSETLIWADPNVGSVGSLSFHLGDILARGEKRKFFVAVTHPDHDVLLQRWPVVLAFLKCVSDRWISAASALVAHEYEFCAALLELREAAARALRPLLTLVKLCSKEDELAPAISTDEAAAQRNALMDFHVMSEVGFSRMFGGMNLQRTLLCVSDAIASTRSAEVLPPGDAGDELTRAILRAVEREYCAVVESTQACFDAKSRCMRVDSPCRELPTPKRVIVRPLAAWLRTMRAAEILGNDFYRKAGRLLKALLTGNQIIISSESDDAVSADFALSLSQILPPTLRRVCVQSNTYVPGYTARIVAFSNEFMDTKEIVQFSTFREGRELLVLSELETAAGAVHVRLNDSEKQEWSFVSVDECCGREDDSGSSFGGNNSSLVRRGMDNNNKQDNNNVQRPTHASVVLPTAVSRVLDLVSVSVASVPEGDKHRNFSGWCHEVALLQSQLELVVHEFSARGRLYAPRFHRQYADNNRAVLGGRVDASRAASTPSSTGGESKASMTVRERIRRFMSRGKPGDAAAGSIRHSQHLSDCLPTSSGAPSGASANTMLSFGRGSALMMNGTGNPLDRDGAASAAGSAYLHPPYYAQQRESGLSAANGAIRGVQDPLLSANPSGSSMAADTTLDLCAARDVDHDVLMFLGSLR